MQEGPRRFLRVQVKDGDIGLCSSDNDPAHGEKFGKTYSERAEIRGAAFQKLGVYEIQFDIRFVQGFDEDNLTSTFFQIKDCPDSRVPVMIVLGGWKKRTGGPAKVGFSLAPGSEGHQWISKELVSDPVDGEWHDVKIIFENYDDHALTVIVDGETWLNRTVFQNSFFCKSPSMRLGIYRAGDSGNNPHSTVDYDKVVIEYKD